MANVELRILTERFELPSHRKRHVVCKTSEFLAYRTFRFGTDRAGCPFGWNSWRSFERLKLLPFLSLPGRICGHGACVCCSVRVEGVVIFCQLSV